MPILREAESEQEIQQCMKIRAEVFVHGLNVPAEREADGLDSECRHFMLIEDGEVIGTSRVPKQSDIAKIERIAILEAFRGKGYGRFMLEQVIAELQKQGHKEICLSAQISSAEFYVKQGFEAVGGIYMDAGIEHVKMVKVASVPDPMTNAG